MKTEDKYGEEWKKQAEYIAQKREEAIKYLGDKWILKGGAYTSKLKVLGQK